jgi:hypothetical protein
MELTDLRSPNPLRKIPRSYWSYEDGNKDNLVDMELYTLVTSIRFQFLHFSYSMLQVTSYWFPEDGRTKGPTGQ